MNIYIDGIIYNRQKTGGISRYFNEYFNELNKIDNDTKIEIIMDKKPIGTLPKKENVSIEKIKQLTIPRPNRIFKPLFQLVNDYIKNRYWGKLTDGVFHSTYFTTYKNLKIPQVLTVYDMIYEKFPSFFHTKSSVEFVTQKKECIDLADAIICISENTKKDLVDYYDVDKNKIYVIYLGVSPDFKKITNKNIKEKFLNKKNIKKPYLLYVGGRDKYKNFLTFIKAYCNLNELNLDIIVVGGGKFTEKEIDLFKKLNIKNKIHNLDFVSNEELILLYNCATAFVFPSLYEGFGIPLLEAMACGTPVATSNSSSLPEVAGNSALYFNPKDINNMTEVIKQVILEGRNSNRIKLGLSRVKNFTWEKTAKETLSVYKKIATKQKRN